MAYQKVDDVAKALIASRGMVSHAARALGCTRATVYNYINKHPTVKAALDDARASLGDRIESTLLYEAMGVQEKDAKGELTGRYTREPNISALIFLAKTHPAMRQRGYAEKQHVEHYGSDGGSLKIELVYPGDTDATDATD